MPRLFRSLVAAFAISMIAVGAADAQRAKIVPPAGTPAATTHLNPNRATEAQLRAVPGITPALAREIVRRRPYASQSDFAKVVADKVPAAQLPALYAAVFVPISLNKASREDIMLIPGMTRRMAHEFEEYRPYKDMAQFDREIGKYVDATELARLRSYVTLP
jgi:DNA uptake protein ComE-like DNA-binding protein